MKEKVQELIDRGFTPSEAVEFVKSVAYDAYDDGFMEGQYYEPAIVGESLGKSGMDFTDWWYEQTHN